MQWLLFLAVAFLVLFVMYAKKNTLSKKVKVLGIIALVHLVGLSWWYEASLQKKNEVHREMIYAFKQGKTLYCGGKEVRLDTFILVSGTLSFIPNDKNKLDKGVVIDMTTCKLEH